MGDKRINAGRAGRDIELSDREKALIREGRNQVLYLLLIEGDENVAHDNFKPAEAERLLALRRRFLIELKSRDSRPLGWPPEYPDFQTYTYRSG